MSAQSIQKARDGLARFGPVEGGPVEEAGGRQAQGESYRIEGSPDLESWESVEEGIQGQGTGVKRHYSIRDQPHRFFRARRE